MDDAERWEHVFAGGGIAASVLVLRLARDGAGPMLVIDGREISWDELGRMVATFEGWQFKLEFRDLSEEV